MVGRGRMGLRRQSDVMGQALTELQAQADAGDPRAQALCNALCAPPDWRERQIAPGIQAPCDDLYPLPLAPRDGNPTFINAGVTNKIFEARPQKPFRGERVAVILNRVGAGAAGITPVITGGILVGTDPQVAQINDMPLEHFVGNAFGVRMVMAPSEPGIDIQVRIQLVGPALAVGETITVFISIFGSTWA